MLYFYCSVSSGQKMTTLIGKFERCKYKFGSQACFRSFILEYECSINVLVIHEIRILKGKMAENDNQYTVDRQQVEEETSFMLEPVRDEVVFCHYFNTFFKTFAILLKFI